MICRCIVLPSHTEKEVHYVWRLRQGDIVIGQGKHDFSFLGRGHERGEQRCVSRHGLPIRWTRRGIRLDSVSFVRNNASEPRCIAGTATFQLTCFLDSWIPDLTGLVGTRIFLVMIFFFFFRDFDGRCYVYCFYWQRLLSFLWLAKFRIIKVENVEFLLSIVFLLFSIKKLVNYFVKFFLLVYIGNVTIGFYKLYISNK